LIVALCCKNGTAEAGLGYGIKCRPGHGQRSPLARTQPEKASRGEADDFRPGSNPDHEEPNRMTKADSVHSTPRITASKFEAKKSAKPAESEEQRNLRHGVAFRDLEAPVLELCRARHRSAAYPPFAT
jgi:hypothetical protein